jgi:hypothetical protein
MAVSDNVYGVLKRKRGNVLSIIVERKEDEDVVEGDAMVREPVPGQRKGLSGPLELDGSGTGLFELPFAVTPRSRSAERYE